jgi:uncharacterized RDD family membrane protein YckC
VYCPNCGQENAAGARYCVTCGTDLRKYTVSTPVSQPGIQTGQFGAPDVKYAGFWLRFVSFIIDAVAIGIVGVIFYIPVIIAFQDVSAEQIVYVSLIFNLVLFVIEWLYFALMEASSKQGTLGKMVIGIIVTDEAGKRISFARATGRHFAKILSSMILYIGFLMIAFTKKKQGLHDLLASTLVIKK